MNIFSIVAEVIRLGADILIPSRKLILEWELQELRKLREELEGRKDYDKAVKVIEEASKIEDVDKAIEYLKSAGKNILCPFCRALIIHMIEYLYKYKVKTELAEQGLDIEKEFKKREHEVKEFVERVKRELNVDDYSLKQSRKDFASMILATLKS